MKGKIVIFIIGVLVGAIIATGAIYAYASVRYAKAEAAQDDMAVPSDMGDGEMPSGGMGDGNAPSDMGDGEMPSGDMGGDAPDKPDGEAEDSGSADGVSDDGSSAE